MNPLRTATTPVYLTREVRRIEEAAAARGEPPPLMERAGRAAAEVARDIVGDTGRPVLVFAGPGNNGGDAFVLARELKRWFFNVSVVFAGEATKLPAEAAAAAAAWRHAGGIFLAEAPRHGRWGLVVDGLFGIGLKREIAGAHAARIAAINDIAAPVLALDIPSGIASDTGRVMGTAVRASHTVTFIGLKPGLLTCDGPDHCGEILVRTLGLDTPADSRPQGSLIGADVLAAALRPRAQNSHKGTYGTVGIIGGATGMTGAAFLAGRAALKLGAGRVHLGLIAPDAPRLDVLHPELMLSGAGAVLKLPALSCLAIGPGLGQSAEAKAHLKTALALNLPLIVDADGLNLIAASTALQRQLRQRKAATLLTPHPGEAARLLGCRTADIQNDRVSAARTLAHEHNANVVVKGAGSVCADADGFWAINVTGNPGMASGGMGDALNGILAALIAQGAPAPIALRAAVYVHGAAADRLVARGRGPAGLTASETIEAARRLINRRADADRPKVESGASR